jgi:hypothetical protein
MEILHANGFFLGRKRTYFHITADFKMISKPITLSYQATAYFTGLS